ncbi:hypothetical protein [Erwinia phage Kuerle]|nr:hypothetical protein [Erwinia phage Kuerle]
MTPVTILSPGIDIRNGDAMSKLPAVAVVICDPVTGLPTLPGGGGGSGTDLTPVLTAIAALQAQIKMPTYSSVTGVSVATNTTGATWTVFGSNACVAFDLVNDTGVAIEYRRNGAGVAITIPAGSSRLITGITNTNQLGVRRVDVANTAVTVKGEAFTV